MTYDVVPLMPGDVIEVAQTFIEMAIRGAPDDFVHTYRARYVGTVEGHDRAKILVFEPET